MFIIKKHEFYDSNATLYIEKTIDTNAIANIANTNITKNDNYKKYNVILKNDSDIITLNHQMSANGLSFGNTNITRPVESYIKSNKIKLSGFKLSIEEADKLKNDPRIQSVQLHPDEMGVIPTKNITYEYSDYWDKTYASSYNTTSNMKNWGLYRCVHGEQVTNWGGYGYNYDGININPTISGSIELTQTGRNVDYVNVDEYGIIENHPEFAVNPDGTGGSRFKEHNWFQYNTYLGYGTEDYINSFYNSFNTGSTSYYNYHPTHVSGIAAGNTQGFARDSNIYHITYEIDGGKYPGYVFDLVKMFHRHKPINPATGQKNPTIMNNSWGYTLPSYAYNYSQITEVSYKGTIYQAPLYSGFSGIFGSLSFNNAFYVVNYKTFDAYENWTIKISLMGNGYISDSSAPIVDGDLIGAASLTEYQTPDTGTNNNGYWTISLPWEVQYFANTVNTVYVSTNSYLSFSKPPLGVPNFDYYNPMIDKICICSGNHSIQRIFYGIEGTTPNRTFRIRVEGDASPTGVSIGSSGMIYEYTFYEPPNNTASQKMNIIIGTNNAKSRTGDTVFASLSGFHLLRETFDIWTSNPIPIRIDAIDMAVQNALLEGVISVGSAGNSRFPAYLPGSTDYNNYIKFEQLYPGSIYYYNRGQSPTASEVNGSYYLPTLCVGAIDSTEIDKKVSFSNSGTMVNIWAPGHMIMSSTSYYYGYEVADSRDSNFYQGKMSGTSMAAPHVTGILACALETYPTMKPQEAIDYIVAISKKDQITATTGPYTDIQFSLHDLHNSPNRFAYYQKEKNTTGTVFPKVNYKPRPISGATYPRNRIRRR